MKRRLGALIAALALAASLAGIATGAPAAAIPTIAIDQAAPAYQTTVTFTVTGLPAKYDCVGHARCARVEVLCSQAGILVYGEGGDLGQARGSGSPLGYSGFLLGGGSSQWINNGGGPADCVANLFRFDNSGPTQQFILLASTSFAAAG